jgi:hypothetical protein
MVTMSRRLDSKHNVDCTPNKTGFSIRRKEQENISSTRLKMKQKNQCIAGYKTLEMVLPKYQCNWN